MDPFTWAAASVLAGIAAGPWAPGTAAGWGLTAAGLGAASLRAPWLAVPAAAFLGVAVSQGLPRGPAWDGPVHVVGVRVGASLGRSADVRVSRWARPGQPWQAVPGRIRVVFPGRPPGPGAPVALLGDAGPVPFALPGAPDPVRAAALARIHTLVRARRSATLVPTHEPRPVHDPTGLLSAVAAGDRSGVSRDTLTRLRRTGTAHLLAISGFHVGVLAAAAAGVAMGMLRAAAAPVRAGWPTHLAAALGVAAAWMYATAAGAPLSAQRAAGLLALVALGRAAGRRTNPLPLLGLVATVIAVVDPSAIATPGYQLSFGAVLGLVVFTPRIDRVLPTLPGPLAWLRTGISATLASTLGTLPAAAWWFQEVAPLSAPANLIAMPVIGLAVVPLAAVATWGPAPLDTGAAWLGSAMAEALLHVLAPFAVDPWTPAVGPLGAVALAGALLVGTARWWAGVGLGALVLGVRAPRGERITVLDVGQGDAIVVEHGGGRTWLVDGGPRPGAVLGWLRRQGIRELEVVVATHGDWDHYGGLLPVLTELPVGELWAVDPPDRLRDAAAVGGVPIVPPRDARWVGSGVGTNDRSIVLDVRPGLLMGDLERAGEAALTPTLTRPVPWLKVGHHGSASSTTPAFLEAARPAVAVISVGAGNRFGHPDPAVLERLRSAGATVLRTDHHGTITLQPADPGEWCATATRRPGPPVCFATATPPRTEPFQARPPD